MKTEIYLTFRFILFLLLLLLLLFFLRHLILSNTVSF